MKKHKPHHIHYKTIGWFICSLAAIFYCYEYLLRIEPSVMIPQLMQTFKITAGSLGILSAMYYYAYTPLQIIVGILIDYFGPRRILIISVALCILGSWVFGLTNTLYIAALGRFLIGIGSAFAFVGVIKLAAIWLPHERFANFVGITVGLGMLGAMVGDIVMSSAVHTFGYHQVINWGTYLGIILLILFFFFIREHHPKNKPHPSAAYPPFKSLAAEFFKMLKRKQLWLAGGVGLILFLSLTAFAEMWGISFIQQTVNVTHQNAAKMNSLVFFGWFVGSPFTGWLSNQIKSRRKLLIIGSLLSAIMITVILLFPQMPKTLLAISLFLFGLFCSTQILCFVVVRESVKLKVAATATSMLNFFVMLGGMLLQPLIGWMLDWLWSGEMLEGIRVYSVRDFQLSLLIIPVLMLVSMFLSYLIKETYRPSHHF